MIINKLSSPKNGMTSVNYFNHIFVKNLYLSSTDTILYEFKNRKAINNCRQHEKCRFNTKCSLYEIMNTHKVHSFQKQKNPFTSLIIHISRGQNMINGMVEEQNLEKIYHVMRTKI